MESKRSDIIDISQGLQTLQRTGTVKLDIMKIEDNILLSPFDFVNYVECKIPEKEAKLQKDYFPLKIHELELSEKKEKFKYSELNPQNELAFKLYNELNAFIFFLVLEDKIIFGDNLGNIKFYSLKENKVIKTLPYPLKNTPEVYKPYAMDTSNDEKISLVGYQNGQIAIFEGAKCKQIIKQENAYNIINIKIINQNKKNFQIIYSDISGNVNLLSLKGKTFGNFEEQIINICKSKPNSPYYLICPLKLKETETNINKTFQDLNETVAFASSEEVVLYTYTNKFNIINTFVKPKYIKESTLPDVAIGLGKQPSNNESTDGDADLLILYLISWDRVIYLKVLPFMNKSIEIVIDSGFYVNDAPIVKIGFLNLSTIYLIDKGGNFKILNSRYFNQGYININEELKIPDVPDNNNKAELQNVIKMEKIRSHSYLNNNLETYIYSVINNKKKNEFYAFGEKTIYKQSLINYQTYLDKLKESNWWDSFILGKNIYIGKTTSFDGIPIKIDERKKRVKEFLQGLIDKYIMDSLNSGKIKDYMAAIIEFCNIVELDNYLFNKMLTDVNLINYKNDFLFQLEPFILCNKMLEVDVPKNVLLEIIQLYQNNNEIIKLDQLLIHFNLNSLNNAEIKNKLVELDLISPQIYILINDVEKDFYTPLTIIYEKYCKAEKLDSFNSYQELVKKKKMPLEKIITYKQYIGHKLLWYLQKTLDGKKFPYFIENIDPRIYFNAVTKITYWLLTEKVFKDLIFSETRIFFNIINYIFSNEDIIETLEENNDDPDKKAEALKILKQYGNNLYTSKNIEASDLISYIVNMGNEILKDDKDGKDKDKKIDEEDLKYRKDKINLYLKIFIIVVAKRIKLELKDKKEAIKFVIQNISKYKVKLDIPQKIVNILEGKDFEIKDYDEILNIMTKGSFDEIRLFILKKKKSYIECLRLLLDKEVKINKLDELIFTFINMTLTRLQIKKRLKEYKTFKEEVKKNLAKISQKSLENCYTIINFWFSKDKKGCLTQLKEIPQTQLDYIEYSIEKILEAKNKNEFEFEESEEYMKYLLERHIQLLCNLNRKNEIITWLQKLNDYPIKECIEICKSGKVYDALIFLYKKEGNIAEALNVCNEIIIVSFNEIVDNIKSNKCNEEIYNSKKKEFIKLIDNAIEAIELEENSYSKDKGKEDKANKHELWAIFLKKLYEIQNKFSKESKIKKEKIGIYEDLSELILNQIQSLIKRMAPYVGVKKVFDYVIKVNPKAQVIEFKPFFNETFKSYGIDKNILSFFIDALNDYSLEEEYILETLNTEGNYFELNQNICHVCLNSLNDPATSAKVIRFKCQHMQHINCCTRKKVCLKCLEINYKKWACRMKLENSTNPDDKDFVEFLKTYDEIKKELGQKKDKKDKKEEKREKNTRGNAGFYKNFKKLIAIDHYDMKNRKNFILEGVKYYMEKHK